MARDELERFIADRARTSPDFLRLVDEALACRQLLRDLAAEREADPPPPTGLAR